MERKILLVHACDLVRGGAEKFLHEWTKNAPQEKYKFIWYCLGEVQDKKYLGEIIENNVVFIEANHRKERKAKCMLNLYKDLIQIFQKDHFDVIHVNSGSPIVEFISICAASKARIPIKIAHSHSCINVENYANYPFTKQIIYTILHFVQRYLRTKATYCAACSKKAGISLFGEEVLASSKWKLIRNLIDTKMYMYNEDVRTLFRKKISDSPCVIMGCIGLLNENKNQIFAIRLVNKLKKNGLQNIKLLLIGKDMLNGKLKKAADELEVADSVIFLGVSDCVEKWLQAMDIFLMPSKSEGLAIAALEAQTAGLPCILSNQIPIEVNVSHNVRFASIDNIDEWFCSVKEFMQLKYNRKEESMFASEMKIDISGITQYMNELYTN